MTSGSANAQMYAFHIQQMVDHMEHARTLLDLARQNLHRAEQDARRDNDDGLLRGLEVYQRALRDTVPNLPDERFLVEYALGPEKREQYDREAAQQEARAKEEERRRLDPTPAETVLNAIAVAWQGLKWAERAERKHARAYGTRGKGYQTKKDDLIKAQATYDRLAAEADEVGVWKDDYSTWRLPDEQGYSYPGDMMSREDVEARRQARQERS